MFTWAAPQWIDSTATSALTPLSTLPASPRSRLLDCGAEPAAAAARSAPGLPPLHALDTVLGPGVVRWRPTGGPDDAGGVPGLQFPGPASRCLDSEHMQQHGISQVRGWAWRMSVSHCPPCHLLMSIESFELRALLQQVTGKP